MCNVVKTLKTGLVIPYLMRNKEQIPYYYAGERWPRNDYSAVAPSVSTYQKVGKREIQSHDIGVA